MAEILTLLSGKGGCGKTTISLAVSKLLSDSNLDVLLIDCDIATNGATYFFEGAMYEKEKVVSLTDILTTNHDGIIALLNKSEKSFLHVGKHFDFIPSNTNFPYESSLDLIGTGLEDLIKSVRTKYDVIICDCQAGYSALLRSAIESSTMNLFVLEPDAISSTSIRVLYAQLSDLLERKRTYQVFSKITKEETYVYDRITSGTMFINAPSIVFNWEIRKALAYSRVPEMATTDNEFGSNIFELTTVLFPMYIKSVSCHFKEVLLSSKDALLISMQEFEYSKKYKNFMRRKRLKRILKFGIPSSVATIFIILISFIKELQTTEAYIYLVPMFTMMTILFTYTFSLDRYDFEHIEGKHEEFRHLEKSISMQIAEVEKNIPVETVD